MDDAAQQYESRPVPFNSTTAANKHLNVVELSDGDMLPIVRVMTPTRVAGAPDGEVARYTLDSTELHRLQYWLTNEDSGCPYAPLPCSNDDCNDADDVPLAALGRAKPTSAHDALSAAFGVSNDDDE